MGEMGDARENGQNRLHEEACDYIRAFCGSKARLSGSLRVVNVCNVAKEQESRAAKSKPS